MKNLLLIPAMFIFIWACSGPKEAAKKTVEFTPGEDSAEYGIVIMDPGFDKWYRINVSPARDRSNEFYREQNKLGVYRWNDYFRTGRYSSIIVTDINFLPETDYGIEVNRKLYWYFRYIEETTGIRLLP